MNNYSSVQVKYYVGVGPDCFVYVCVFDNSYFDDVMYRAVVIIY